MSPDTITLGEIDRKLDSIKASVDEVLKDHEHRLRSLERWAYAIPPTLIIATGSIIATIVKA